MTFFEGAGLCGNTAESVSHWKRWRVGRGGIASLTGSCPSLPQTPSSRTSSSGHPRTARTDQRNTWTADSVSTEGTILQTVACSVRGSEGHERSWRCLDRDFRTAPCTGFNYS